MTRIKDALQRSDDYWREEPERFVSAYEKSLSPAKFILRDLLLKRNAAALRLIGDESGDVFVDIGCGSGDLLKIVSASNATTYGIDYSEEMLRIARRNLENESVNLILSDCDPIPFETDHVDKVSCLGVVEYVADVRSFFFEVSRIMKPGGTFVFTAPRTISLFAPSRWSSRFRRGVIDLPPVVNTFYMRELKALVADAGFEITDVQSIWGTMWIVRAVRNLPEA